MYSEGINITTKWYQ